MFKLGYVASVILTHKHYVLFNNINAELSAIYLTTQEAQLPRQLHKCLSIGSLTDRAIRWTLHLFDIII